MPPLLLAHFCRGLCTSAPQVSFTPGAQYYITVQASNDAGAGQGGREARQQGLPCFQGSLACPCVRPHAGLPAGPCPERPALPPAAPCASLPAAGQVLGTMLSSEPIVADTSPPYLPEGSSVYSGQDFTNQATQVGGVGWCSSGVLYRRAAVLLAGAQSRAASSRGRCARCPGWLSRHLTGPRFQLPSLPTPRNRRRARARRWRRRLTPLWTTRRAWTSTRTRCLFLFGKGGWGVLLLKQAGNSGNRFRGLGWWGTLDTTRFACRPLCELRTTPPPPRPPLCPPLPPHRQVFEFAGQQAGDPGYVGAAVTNKTRVGGWVGGAVWEGFWGRGWRVSVWLQVQPGRAPRGSKSPCRAAACTWRPTPQHTAPQP